MVGGMFPLPGPGWLNMGLPPGMPCGGGPCPFGWYTVDGLREEHAEEGEARPRHHHRTQHLHREAASM